MYEDRRGLRFTFNASAEIALKDAPKAIFPGRVTELSLQGCFVETFSACDLQRVVLLKIENSQEVFEAEATVLYVRPNGVGLVFRELALESRSVLQKWMIKALDSQLAPL